MGACKRALGYARGNFLSTGSRLLSLFFRRESIGWAAVCALRGPRPDRTPGYSRAPTYGSIGYGRPGLYETVPEGMSVGGSVDPSACGCPQVVILDLASRKIAVAARVRPRHRSGPYGSRSTSHAQSRRGYIAPYPSRKSVRGESARAPRGRFRVHSIPCRCNESLIRSFKPIEGRGGNWFSSLPITHSRSRCRRASLSYPAFRHGKRVRPRASGLDVRAISTPDVLMIRASPERPSARRRW